MRSSGIVVVLALALAACDDAPTAPRAPMADAVAPPTRSTTLGDLASADAAIREYVPNAPPLAGVERLKRELAVPPGTLPKKLTDPWTGQEFGSALTDCQDEYRWLQESLAILRATQLAADLALKGGDPASISASAAALALAKLNYEHAQAAYERCLDGESGAGGGTVGGSTGGGTGGAPGSGDGGVDLGDFNCTTKLGIKTCVPVAH